MMKLSSVVVVLVVGMLANAAWVVQAETMLRMILNNGTIAPPSMFCTAAENILIGKVFDRPLNRRNLRGVEQTDQHVDFVDHIEITHDEHDRNLQFVGTLSYCREECKGYTSGYCHKTGCGWYNKHRNLQNYAKGFLSNSTLCTSTASSISSDLEFLISQGSLSSACGDLLKTRKLECFEDVMYGIIEQFSVIDADIDTKVISFLHARQTICSGRPLNFQVLVNPCVQSVNITLINRKAGYRADTIINTTLPGPFSLFGSKESNANDFNGQHLPLGNFTIDAIPDGFIGKTRTRNFIIAEC